MKHKWLFAAAIGTAVIVAPVAADASFKDVKQGTEQAEAIKSLVERNVISGYQDGTFKPSNEVTRSQFAKILAGALQLDTQNVKDPGFKDVKATHPNYKYIAALANAGIISGSNGKFNPNGKVTRGQLAKMLAVGYELNATNYMYIPFNDAINSANLPYIKSLYMYGITNGVTADQFGINKPVTRGNLATFIYRTENYKALPAYDETVTGAEVSLDHVQFEVGQLRVVTNDLENPNIIEAVLNEGGDKITFKPIQAGTAYVNVVGFTPDVDGDLAHVGYQLDVVEVNGELRVTMSALEEPMPLLTTVASGAYTDVAVYNDAGEELDISYQVIESEYEEGNDVQIAVAGGAYKVVLTTEAGTKEEKYVIIYEDSYSPEVVQGQLFTEKIEFDIHPDIEELIYYVDENDSFELDINTKPGKLIVHNPRAIDFSLDFVINGENKFAGGSIIPFGEGYVVSNSLINMLQKGGY